MTTQSNAIESARDALVKRVNRKTLWRLMPFLMLCYFINYLDRSNLSIAAVNGMNEDLGLTATTYGIAAGVFFIGYILLEIPSNLALHKFGARKWISRIMVSWGAVACLIAFVPNANWLYTMRFLLGVAEAGFTPGILLYLTYWFVQKNRGLANSLFLVGIPLSNVIGAPVASWLVAIGHDIMFGLTGWRFMIFITGVPAVLLGIMCWFFLTDRPADAKWLTAEERAVLIEEMAKEDAGEVHEASALGALKSARAWILGLGYFGLVFGLYAISFFLPTIIRGFQEMYNVEYSTVEIGLLTAIPYAFAVVALLVWAFRSRRTGEASNLIAISAVVAVVGIIIAVSAHSPTLTLVGVTLVAMGVCSSIPLFFTLPTKFTAGAAAAAALAMVNTLGNLGGFAGPYIFGFTKDLTGGTTAGMMVIAALCLVSAAIALLTKRWKSV